MLMTFVGSVPLVPDFKKSWIKIRVIGEALNDAKPVVFNARLNVVDAEKVIL